MATFIDSAILITKPLENVKLSLACGYGQPVTTRVYLKKTNGNCEKLTEFDLNITDYLIGQSDELRANIIEVHSTIHDIRDYIPGQEVEDIRLIVRLFCADAAVEMDIKKKTKGTGELINCFYEVTIL